MAQIETEKMYNYQQERKFVFTEEGQLKFLKVRDHVNDLAKKSGAFTMMAAMSVITGDTWGSMACVDRLVEIGEIREIPQSNVSGQNRIFVKC